MLHAAPAIPPVVRSPTDEATADAASAMVTSTQSSSARPTIGKLPARLRRDRADGDRPQSDGERGDRDAVQAADRQRRG